MMSFYSSQISNIEGLFGPIFQNNQNENNQSSNYGDDSGSSELSDDLEITKVKRPKPKSLNNPAVSSMISHDEVYNSDKKSEKFLRLLEETKERLLSLENKSIEIFTDQWEILNNKDILECFWVKSQNEHHDLIFTLTNSGEIICEIFCQNFDNDLFRHTMVLLNVTDTFYFNEIWNTIEGDLKDIWMTLSTWIDLESYTDDKSAKFIFNFYREMQKNKNIDQYLDEFLSILKNDKHKFANNIEIEFIGLTFKDYYALQEIIEMNLLNLILKDCILFINESYNFEEIKGNYLMHPNELTNQVINNKILFMNYLFLQYY